MMAALQIFTRNGPCTGSSLHHLTCGHTIRAPLLSTLSSKCALNCSANKRTTTTEAEFLCPKCYETRLEARYEDFEQRCEHNARLDGTSMEVVVKQVKGTYDSGVKGEKGEFDRWYDVWLGELSFGHVFRDSYKWTWQVEGLRRRRAIGT